MIRSRPSWITAVTAIMGLLALFAASMSLGAASAVPRALAASAAAQRHTVGYGPKMTVGPVVARGRSQPPTSAQCAAATGGVVKACYGPADLHAQYNYTPLYSKGITGQGQTIVIFDSFGSPTIASDLATFDAAYGLPAPPSFVIYHPEGNVVLNYDKLPSPVDFHNKNINTEIGWAYETTLDVEWAHAMAPAANIALVTVPVPETQGVQGLQNLINAQQWVLAHHIGTIWSNSYATTEQAFNATSSLLNLNKWYTTAAADGVSNFFASGDSGVANADKQGRLYPFPTVTFPSSSPSVISVGGTEIPAPPPTITSYQPEAAWNDCCGSGGGGYSSIFGEPSYQTSAGIPDPSRMRGVPDVSYNAALVSAILIYESFDPVGGAGWVIIGGTSAATPQWAAIDALANQADGALGFLTPRLYQIYTNKAAYASAFHDITVGNNSWAGITGYAAGPGWDPATGLGTPNVTNLVTALAATR
ncbi:MAG: S53 family peptidase [Ktedonobacterales bacterium]